MGSNETNTLQANLLLLSFLKVFTIFSVLALQQYSLLFSQIYASNLILFMLCQFLYQTFYQIFSPWLYYSINQFYNNVMALCFSTYNFFTTASNLVWFWVSADLLLSCLSMFEFEFGSFYKKLREKKGGNGKKKKNQPRLFVFNFSLRKGIRYKVSHNKK